MYICAFAYHVPAPRDLGKYIAETRLFIHGQEGREMVDNLGDRTVCVIRSTLVKDHNMVLVSGRTFVSVQQDGGAVSEINMKVVFSAPAGQRLACIAIEPPAVNRIAVLTKGMWYVDVKQPAWLHNGKHFEEGHPEARIVLEGAAGGNHVKVVVGERIRLVLQRNNNVDIRASFDVDTSVVYVLVGAHQVTGMER